MQTQLKFADAAALEQALQLLRAGEAIALPTDTVYGLAADGLSATAVLRLYEIKSRPRSQAIPLLLGEAEDLAQVASHIPDAAWQLSARFWPGGLTLVVPAAAHLPPELLAGGTTVAVRLPDHPLVRQLCRALGRPLAATSANLHAGPNPRTAADVEQQLGGRLPLILDGGPTPGDVPSTIIDLSAERPRLLRPGAIDPALIMAILNQAH